MTAMLNKLQRFLARLNTLSERVTLIQESLGRIEARQTADAGDPRAAEFRVFSQWGEDGIIQHLVRNVPIERPIFVEFGVENYVESNTRFLLTNNAWSGLVIDGSEDNIEYIRRDPIYWASNLKAHCSFITKDNINQLLASNGIAGDIGLLSVDIDGNDYWVWEAIDTISPRIVVCEYSSQFGPVAQVTTPYDPAFVRGNAHWSKVYYGASICALCALAERKGYSLVASNSAGNNVFFVRNDLVGDLKVLTPAEAYRRARFREFHDEQGRLTFDDFETRLDKIRELPVYDLQAQRLAKIADIPAMWETKQRGA
ncbi:hypothetical protein [Ramlibacter sp.]|uniref:hypothetical protein n=1 Tax=Ramlibacter sp. TaxID=1917967 RepID=UPI003D0B51F8